MKRNIGKVQGDFLLQNTDLLKDVLARISNGRLTQKEKKYFKRDVVHVLETYEYYIDLFKRMKNKFHELSSEQDFFLDLACKITDAVIDSKILNFLKSDGSMEDITLVSEGNTTQCSQESKDFGEFFEKSFQKISSNLQLMKDFLEDYLCRDLGWYSFTRLKKIWNSDFLGTLNQYRIEMSPTFDFEEYKFKTRDGEILDYVIIKGAKDDSLDSDVKNNLMIICGPNGAPFEFFIKNISLDLYLSKGIDVLCWNYRGYGYSTGKSNFDNLRSDVIELFEHIERTGRWGKFGVHGISIGGIPSCYLANKKNVEVLVSDRNFGSIDMLANSFKFGGVLFFLYKCLILPSSLTVYDYVHAKCMKIICNDPQDRIVLEPCSLKSLTSKYIVNHYMKKKPQASSSSIELLESRIVSNTNENNSHLPVNNYPDVANEEDEEANLDGLDFLFNESRSKTKFINSLVNISLMLENEQFDLAPQGLYGFCCGLLGLVLRRNKNYSNLKEEELQNTSGVYDFVRNKLSDFLRNLESAGDTLESIFDYSQIRLKKIFVKMFFTNLLVWGNPEEKSFDFANSTNFTTVNNQRVISDVISYLKSFLDSQEVQSLKGKKIITEVSNLIGLFTEMEQNLKLLSFKKINQGEIQTQLSMTALRTSEVSTESMSEEDSYENSLIQIGKGNLVSLSCGHNGNFNHNEKLLFSRYLTQSGIDKRKELEVQ